jgi:hypothetical protein
LIDVNSVGTYHISKVHDIYMSVYLLVMVFLIQNTIPMIVWHITQMEKAIVKLIKESSTTATRFEKRQYKQYGTLTSRGKQIEYDTKHGITKEQDLLISQKILNHSSYSRLFDNVVSLTELNEIENYFIQVKEK